MSRATPPPFPVIVGCPRSGTSLAAVMLDSHPDLAMPPETAFLKYVPGLSGEAESLRRRFVELVTADRTPLSNWSDFGLDRGVFEARIGTISPFTVADAARSFYAMYAAAQGKRRAGEKTPDNIFVMRELAALMPEIHYVHVIRDPRDTVLSWRKTWFAPSQDYGALGAAWQQQVAIGRAAGAAVAHYHELRYEDLVLHPEVELPRVCAFLGLEYSARMLDFTAQGAARIARLRGRRHVSGRMVERDDRTRIHENLVRPPQQDRIGVWRREMSAADRAAVERAASPLLASLGYSQ